MEKINPNLLRGPYYAGLDLGKQVDHSVLAIVQKAEGRIRLVHKRQFLLGTPYPDVIAYVAKAHQVFQFQDLFVDKTGIGDAVVDELEDVGILGVKGVYFTDAERKYA